MSAEALYSFLNMRVPKNQRFQYKTTTPNDSFEIVVLVWSDPSPWWSLYLNTSICSNAFYIHRGIVVCVPNRMIILAPSTWTCNFSGQVVRIALWENCLAEAGQCEPFASMFFWWVLKTIMKRSMSWWKYLWVKMLGCSKVWKLDCRDELYPRSHQLEDERHVSIYK